MWKYFQRILYNKVTGHLLDWGINDVVSLYNHKRYSGTSITILLATNGPSTCI